MGHNLKEETFMHDYIGDQAAKALEWLCADYSLGQRLKGAQSCLQHAEKFLSTAPKEVTEAIKKAITFDVEEDLDGASSVIRDALMKVFKEWGRKNEGDSDR